MLGQLETVGWLKSLEFQNQYKDDLTCRVCKAITSVENEDHLLLCEELNNKKYDVQFSDVFGNTDQQYNAVIAFKQVLRRRKVYFDIFNNSSSWWPSCVSLTVTVVLIIYMYYMDLNIYIKLHGNWIISENLQIQKVIFNWMNYQST